MTAIGSYNAAAWLDAGWEVATISYFRIHKGVDDLEAIWQFIARDAPQFAATLTDRILLALIGCRAFHVWAESFRS